MNETNIKHGYSLMVREARAQRRYFESRGANFKSRGRIYATRSAILKSGTQGRNAWAPRGWIFLTMLAPGAGPLVLKYGRCRINLYDILP